MKLAELLSSLLYAMLLTVCVVQSFVIPTNTINVNGIKGISFKTSTVVLQPQEQTQYSRISSLSLSENSEEKPKSKLPVFLDPGTKGGVIVLSILLFALPLIGVNIATSTFGLDEDEVGRWVGALFTLILSLVWASTYIFRVATKDMTYAKQLKDYEDAVIAKRLEELDEDEVQALVEEIERDDILPIGQVNDAF